MRPRALLYARYSSDRQQMTSIEDQVAMMTAYCDAQGWDVAAVFSDAEKTGRHMRRAGVQALLRAIEAGAGDIVVVEATDRLTRRIADGLNTFDLFRHRGTRLVSVTEGEQDFLRMLITAMGAQFAAENIGVHTQRALHAGLKRGRLVTKAYGYRIVPGAQGLNREIDADEAAVVLRIFEAFAEGRSAEAIARSLNLDGVPSPTGGTWHGSTIRDNSTRNEGILRNPLYRGVATIGATQRSHHPETGARRVTPTPERAVTVELPELRIVPEPLWDAVQAELARRTAMIGPARKIVAARRTRYLLSGLLTCGCCGASYVIGSRTSYYCHERGKGVCTTSRAISRRRLEARVFDRIRAVMRSDDVRASFAAAMEAERAKLLATDVDGAIADARARRAEAQAKLDAIVAAIEDGAPYAAFKAQAKARADEIAGLDARIAELDARRRAQQVPDRSADAVFDAALSEMETLLGDPDLVEQAHTYLARLIDRIVIHTDDAAPHGVRIKLRVPDGSILAASGRVPADARVAIAC
jgi:DNA invertase Pin-like site-specific DNA recombinase